MNHILFQFIIYPSCERSLNNGRVKLKMFRKSSLNFTFDQGSCLTSDLARQNSNKAVLLQISLRFDIGIFNNNFVFCVAVFLEPVMSSFCSMPGLAAWFLVREMIKLIGVFYPVFCKKVLKKARQTSVMEFIL